MEAVIDAGKLLEKRATERAEQKKSREEGEGITGERGAADLKTGRKATARGARAFVAVIVGLGLLIAIFVAGKAYSLRKEDEQKSATPSGRVEKKVGSLKLAAPAANVGKADKGTPPMAQLPGRGGEGEVKLAMVAPSAVPATGGSGEQGGHESSVQSRRLARGFGGTTGDEGGLGPGAQGERDAPVPMAGPRTGGFEDKLEPTELRATAATAMGDRDYSITQGASLDCVLQTKIITSVPGMTSCYLTRNVYSTNGRVVLLDRGSKIVGRYQGGVQQGETRIFVVWTRAETPNGVVVNLDSPGTGELGEAGVGGWTDTHFWDRFSAALMVSLIQSGSTAAAAGVPGANIIEKPVNTANDAVAKTYEHTINMAPTVYVNQGERVSIFVARDLNFRSVYGLEPVRHDE